MLFSASTCLDARRDPGAVTVPHEIAGRDPHELLPRSGSQRLKAALHMDSHRTMLRGGILRGETNVHPQQTLSFGRPPRNI